MENKKTITVIRYEVKMSTLTQEKVLEYRKLWIAVQNGKTAVSLAKKLGVSPSTIKQRIERYKKWLVNNGY